MGVEGPFNREIPKGRNRETDPHKLDKKLSAHLFGLSIFRVFAIPASINEPQISVLTEH